MIPTRRTVPTVAAPVYCGCGVEGVWNDYGPTVGRGWYCKACKNDIPHADNVFGITGIQIQKKLKEEPPKGTARFGAHPNPPTPAGINTNKVYAALECVKPQCPVCGGIMKTVKPITVRVGDMLRCNSGTGMHLKAQQEYQVAEVLTYTVKVWCVRNGKLEAREYARCRFSKVN